MRIVPVLLAAAWLAGCDEPTSETPGEYTATGDVIAEINGQPLHQDLVDVLLKRIPESQRVSLEQSGQIGQLKEQVVLTEVLYQEALKQNLHTDPMTAVSIAFATRSALADALVGQVIDERMTDERIQQWYNDHLVRYAEPQIKLSHIILDDEAKAEALMTQIQGGADFATLARDNSIDPRTKDSGGKLDEWVPTTQIQGEVGTALGNANPGDVVGPFPMGPGVVALLKVDERRDQTPIEDVRDEIAAELEQELTSEYIDEIRNAAQVDDKSGAAAPTDAAPPAEGQDAQ